MQPRRVSQPRQLAALKNSSSLALAMKASTLIVGVTALYFQDLRRRARNCIVHKLDTLSDINNEGCMSQFSTITLTSEKDVYGLVEFGLSEANAFG